MAAVELPLFPLHLVLFPGRPLPLHLFEPRYRTMLRDCMANGRKFGVVAIRSGRDAGGAADVFDVGTVASIESVDELPDGRFDIATRGVQRFRVRRLLDDRPYLRGDVELLDEPEPTPADLARGDELRRLLGPYLRSLGAPLELVARLPKDPASLANLAAATLQVEVPQQQRLLEMDDLSERLAATAAVVRREASLMRRFGAVATLRPPGPCGHQLN